MEGLKRDLALFNLAIDSKSRGCDVVAVRVGDVAPNGYALDRATVRHPWAECGGSAWPRTMKSYAHPGPEPGRSPFNSGHPKYSVRWDRSDLVRCPLLYKSRVLVFGHNSARDIDNQRDPSVAALVLGRHVGCVRAGLPKSNRRQLTWLHAGMDKML